MPVELYVGRPATGKTQTCIQRVRGTLSSQLLSEVWVIVPDRLQASAFRRRIAQAGGAIGAHVGTFGDLYRSILERSGNNVPVASAPFLHYIIHEIVDLSARRGELIHYAPLCTLPGFFLVLRELFCRAKAFLDIS